MAKEILIYGGFFDFMAEDFHDRLIAAESEGEDITLAINSNGGDVDTGFGMIRMFQKFSRTKHVEIHGVAKSMAAFFLLYADTVTSLDVSDIGFHRAAFPSFIENDSELFTEERRGSLAKTNKDLKRALLAKVDPNEFKRITGTSINELFSMDGRIEVFMTPTQAKQLGIVTNIVNITPVKRASIQANALKIAANIEVPEVPNVEEHIEEKKHLTQNTIMDINKLQIEHPSVYAQILALGVIKGVEDEKDRVQAWVVFADIDMKAVTEGIDSGKGISAKAQAEFNRKASSVESLKSLEREAADDNKVKPEDVVPKTEEEKNITAFKDEVYKKMDIKTKAA